MTTGFSRNAQLLICHTCENQHGWGSTRVVYEPEDDDTRRTFLAIHQGHGK